MKEPPCSSVVDVCERRSCVVCRCSMQYGDIHDDTERRMSAPRTMTVHIPVFMIGDGSSGPVEIGSVLEGPLDVREVSPIDPDAVTIRAKSIPSGEKPRWSCIPEGAPARWMCTGFLRGDGWSAAWRGSSPRTACIEVSGRFEYGFNYATDGRFRGRVTRARVATERYRQDSDGRWVPVPGHRVERDIERADRFIDGEPVSDTGRENVDMDAAVIVDLDHVPPLPPRPSIVPGGVFAAGTTIWVVDSVPVAELDGFHR